jgi:hypothetical protein
MRRNRGICLAGTKSWWGRKLRRHTIGPTRIVSHNPNSYSGRPRGPRRCRCRVLLPYTIHSSSIRTRIPRLSRRRPVTRGSSKPCRGARIHATFNQSAATKRTRRERYHKTPKHVPSLRRVSANSDERGGLRRLLTSKPRWARACRRVAPVARHAHHFECHVGLTAPPG